MSEELKYLTDASRFPKQTVTPVVSPTRQISSEEYNRLVSAVDNLEHERYSPPNFDVDMSDGCVYISDIEVMGVRFGLSADGELYYEYVM